MKIEGDCSAVPPLQFVCAACGKHSDTKYGIYGEHSPGWDASCMLNSVLCRPASKKEQQTTGLRWFAVQD